jgi:phosphoribosyl 1,2-cyclic phosphodiesterase
MNLKIWGARGSVASPGPATVRYGGNTSCVQVTLADGTQLILDAGTGIRNLGLAMDEPATDMHILLTHLHLDHIQGLLFFAPLFNPDSKITIWGPMAQGGTLQNRIARYLSAPLTPIEVRELPSHPDFRDCPTTDWELGSARITAQAVNHRGATLGFRIADEAGVLCYIPDHEPALAGPLDGLESSWISGYALAHDADLLLHDCQYTEAEYPYYVGWGHSSVGDALRFVRRVEAGRVVLFHHDPLHSDDDLDNLSEAATEAFAELGGQPEAIELAVELEELEIRHDTNRSG